MEKASKKVILQNVRCSYVYLESVNKNDKYSVQPLIEKDSANYKKIVAAQKEVFIQAFGEAAWKKKGSYNLAIRDGDADQKNGGEPRDGEEYRDVIFLNANSSRKPGIVNRKLEPADEDDMDEYAYSGAYFHVSINLYAFPQPEDGGKAGIAAGLGNVMLRKKGDRLDGSIAATSEFADFAEDSDDDFDDDDL